jgi:hypothetical protein
LADMCVPFPSTLFLFPNFIYFCIYELLSGVKRDGWHAWSKTGELFGTT